MSKVVEYIRSLQLAEGGAYASAECENMTNLDGAALKQLRDAFAIVYWTGANGQCWYPKWQFDGDNLVRPEVRQILGLLHTHDTHHVLSSFLVPVIGDAGESPLDLIRVGRGAEAVEFVRLSVRQR